MKRQFLISLFVLFFASGFAWALDPRWSGFADQSDNASAAYKQNELIVRFADPDTGSQLPEGPVLAGPLTRRAIRSKISDFIVAGAAVDKEYDEVSPGVAVVKLPEGTSVLEAGIKFLRSANVLYAEPNYKYTLFAVPNDPFFVDLWGMNNTGQTGGTEDADIDAPEAWDITTGSSDIVVAVIDSGIDYRHPDLIANMWVNAAEQNGTPGVDDDNNGYFDDIYGYDLAGPSATRSNDGKSDPKDAWFHGTHVAGIIGAVGNNGQGVAGVCWNVKLMALKIYADDFNTRPETFASDAILAIQYAIDNGADIINFSSGGEYDSQALKDAIKKAGDAGVLFVTSAGNDYGSDNDVNPVYPASYDLDNIISVMSTDPNDLMADFSNYGATSVDIAAPGTDIVSTTPTTGNLAMTVFGGISTNYDMLSFTSHGTSYGTSQATGYISGASALVWSHYPALPKEVIKGLLMKTVDPVLTTPMRCLSGGRVNLYNALTLIPSGKPGRVINTKNPEHLYNTIRSAIDDANDGDELIAEAGTLFFEGIDFGGKAITLRSGDINEPADANISPENTLILGILSDGSAVTFANNEGPGTVLKGFTISRGNADYGGGIRCDGASPTITDCIITNNIAKYFGGGIDCTNNSSPTIKNCTIANNQTSSSNAIGGGINCEDSSPTIENCIISYNFADNVGGGIACYNSNPVIINCLIANNSAIYKGAGIDLESSSPVITNCTIVIDEPNAPKDGGIFAYHNSSPIIKNCILWGNGDDLYGCSAAYSCIEDDDEGIGNIHIAPVFVTGPLGRYYLSQKAAGQLADSSGIDLGDPATDPDLKLNTYTTRTDGVTDTGAVDAGFHYPVVPAKNVQLNVTVIGNGSVEPGSGTYTYRQYEVVELKAVPNDGHRIKAWTGTGDDSSKEPVKTITLVADSSVTVEFEVIPMYQLRTEVTGSNGTISPYNRRGEYYPEGTVVTLTATPDLNYIVDQWDGTDDDTVWSSTNTVTMGSDKVVTIKFRQPKSLHVPGQYRSISDAIGAAYDHGDKIIVSAGSYFGGIDFQGKAVTVASEHPDDPSCVAATVIRVSGMPAFIFQSGEGHDSTVDGFTIQGAGDPGPIDPYGTADDSSGVGTNATPVLGGAISCRNGSSPTLSHLVIKDVVARGQKGQDAGFVFDPPAAPPDPLDPLDPNEALPDLPEIDPTDPSTYDPNNVETWDPNDPNTPDPASPIDGMDGEAGADGLPGEPGMDGANGLPGYKGGDGGDVYGGAMYFDANSSPIITYCKIINCQAIGGDGGFGGQGQNGQGGQGSQAGQNGQEGQTGQAGYNDGDTGEDGPGGAGGDGGPGGNGGRGGNGGKGGDGGEALGGAIYFGPGCRPTIRYCTITSSSTQQGLGALGGNAGNGGDGGAGAAAGEGAGDSDNGADGPGGNGGDGGTGGDMGINGPRSWAGAIFYGENCVVEMTETTISQCATSIYAPTLAYEGGDGGTGGNGGDGEGDAAGGAGGTGGDGGIGGPDDDDPGSGGQGGEGGDAGGAAGDAGADGASGSSFTSGYAPANYYDAGCEAKLTKCKISYNESRTFFDGGGELYRAECTAIMEKCEFVRNFSGFRGGAQFFDWGCSVDINDCNYVSNSARGDGGGLYLMVDFSLKVNNGRFLSNSSSGSGGGVFGGGVWNPEESKWYNNSTITIENSQFIKNKSALYGGGLYWHGDDSDISISNSAIHNNIAQHGGGLYWSNGPAKIIGCSIKGNAAREPWTTLGGGGGIFCWSSDAKIESCFISDNSALGSGGGIYFGGDPNVPVLRNCLVKNNTAVLDGGGIAAYWSVAPKITNCTIVDNTAFDPHDTMHGRGGGLSCSYESRTTLTDSILWGNAANKGSQIAIGSISEPIYLDRPATLWISYCDIQGGKSSESVHVEPQRTLIWDENSNINADPLFVGSLYYLSQIAAGQSSNSPCVDAGSDTAVNLSLYQHSTRSDGEYDVGIVDMGLHYPTGDGQHRLTVNVIGEEHGTVEPKGDLFNKYTVVTLTAKVDPGYRVKWIGTDDDSSIALSNTVTMYSDRTVTAKIKMPATIKVPGDYLLIQEAVDAASDGDVIVINKGRHRGARITVTNKAITLTSTNPDDPDIVAETIIDGAGYIMRGINISSGCGPDTVINGLTITNCGWGVTGANDGFEDGDDGDNGGFAAGGGIYINQGASPTIVNCIITNTAIRGGDGGDGAGGDDDPNDPAVALGREHYNFREIRNGGNGGTGGDVFGAGIFCDSYSSPTIRNCRISNSTVTGADGGVGAPGFSADLADTPSDPSGGDGGFGGDGGGAYGGGIYVGYKSSPTIDGCTITNCSAIGGNGGDGGNGGNAVTDDNNALGGWGGDGGEPGQAYGGGIYFAEKAEAVVSNCRIISCSTNAGDGGDGGDYGDAQSLWGIGGFGGGYYDVYRRNSAYGGGVFCDNDSKITFMNCSLENNSITGGMSGTGGANVINNQPPRVSYLIPSYGAGVFGDASSSLRFTDCDILANQAGQGLVGLDPNAPTDPNDPNYVDPNSLAYRLDPYVSYGGGICYIEAATVIVADCNFSYNYATLGGGMYWSKTRSEVTDSNFADNSAFKGGAIFAIDSAASTIKGCSITGNQASAPGGEGGGLYCATIPALIADCQIRFNSADYSGGGLYSSGSTSEPARLRNCLIAGNTAVRDGGGVSASLHNELEISSCTIADNETTGAYSRGGGLYCSYGSFADVIDSIIWGNVSSYDGSQVAVASGDPAYPQPSKVNITYSDIQPDPNEDEMVGPSGLDLVICIDTTGSMWGEIDAVKNSATEIIREIEATIPNYRIAVVDYRDFNEVPYGYPPVDYPYNDDSVFTNNIATLVAGINSITLGAGVDWEESVSAALMHCINHSLLLARLGTNLHGADPNSTGPGAWRAGPSISRVIILMADAPPHDPEPFTNYTPDDIIAAATALPAPIKIFPIVTGFGVGDPTVESYLGRYADGTGGAMLTAPEPEEVVDRIMEVVRLVATMAPMIDVEDGCVLNWDPDSRLWASGSHNISEDPNFVVGYYLSQIAAGEMTDSPCVDAGSADADELGMELYTTRTDGVADINIVDMGYHYQIVPMPLLDISVVDANGVPTTDPNLSHGYIEPAGRRYPQGTVVQLTAHTTPGYRVKAWTGTDNDSSKAMSNTVTMTRNKRVTVEFELDIYQLTTMVAGGHGAVEPNSGPLNAGVVELRAYPEQGYRVKSWTGTDNDPAWNHNTNTVTLDRNKTVTVEFEPDVTRNLLVPSEYLTIEQAMTAAVSGNNIVVSKGVHLVSSPDGIDFQSKAVTLMSTDPDDPDVIANTIIDCQGARLSNNRAFHFHSGEDFNTKVMGFTIRNGYINGGNGTFGRYGAMTSIPYELQPDDDPDPNQTPPRAERGGDIQGNGYGGGILCENGSSPTIKNCTITNCMVTGAHGGNGASGWNPVPPGFDLSLLPDEWTFFPPTADDTETSSDGQWGGHAGTGMGNGYGGAIACLTGSCPIINNCIIKDNAAHGGMGGDGGQGGSTSGGAESGGGYGGDAMGDGIGGGIYSDNQSCPIVTYCKFINNIAATGIPGQGGAVGQGDALDPRAQPGSIGFVSSYGGIAGGAAYFADTSDANFANCEFTENKAYIRDRSLDMFTGTYVLTYAYTRGGALYSEMNNTVTLKNCDFTGNLGGAVYCSSGCTLDTDNCSFKDNAEAPEGGAIYIADRVQTDVNDSIFSGNTALGDGGAVRLLSDANFTDCTFIGNIANESGGAIDAYLDTGNPEERVILRLNFESCSFSGNKAIEGFYGYGGGLRLHDFEANFNNCYILSNTAKSGGGLFLSGGTVAINGGAINANKSIGGSGIDLRNEQDILDTYLTNVSAFDDYILFYFDDPSIIGEFEYSSSHDIGGGLVCADTEATIENCTFSDNIADGVSGSGGAINFYGGFVKHSIKNCLLTGNSAAEDGGAISCNLSAKPEIKNCTFNENQTDGMGGAIFCDWSSDATISDSIFQSCNNGAISEEDVGNTTVKYSVFYNNMDGDYRVYDTINQQVNTSTGTELDATNIQADPLFVDGPLGKFYLSQPLSELDQTLSSPALNTGSGYAVDLGLSDFTTRIDGVEDSNQVDIGYHYVDHRMLPQYKLTGGVISGLGGITPINGVYYSGTLVTLTAVPNVGWRVAGWTGTITDASKAQTNYVLMNSDRSVGVVFDQPRIIVVASDAEYTTIKHAIDDANDGDVIIVPPGEYSAAASHDDRWYGFEMIEIHDKQITLKGTNPLDPNVVANTILDNYWFRIYNVGPDTIIDGITIRNSQRDAGVTVNATPAADDGGPGFSLYGGAMQILNASPTIRNCVFTENSVTGGDGAPGDNGVDPEHLVGFDGGWAGRAYGGAVYCMYKSNPTFENCSFTNNFARGGNGGNGGVGANGVIGGRGGSWEWAETLEAIFAATWWDGWQYGDKAGGTPYDAFQDPYTKYSGYGGAVYCKNHSSPKFIDCKFENNHTYGGVCGIGGNQWPHPDRVLKIENAGGAVYACENSNPEFLNCIFTGNSADRSNDFIATDGTASTVIGNDDPYISYGGAVAFEDDCSPKFTNCTFTDGQACIGGGIWWSKSTATIIDCNFADNTAYHGGGVYGAWGLAEVGRSVFNQNEALIDANIPSIVDPNVLEKVLGEGGAMHFYDTDAKIYNCNITRNEAFAGGGIYGSYSILSITDCNIADSNAYHGGGLYSIGSRGTISGTTVTRNRAVLMPSAVFPTSDVNDANIMFFDPNISVYGQGGGYYNTSSNIDVTNSIFSNNEANGSGGGIYYSGSDINSSFTPLLHDSLLNGNKAGSDGGGVSANSYVELTISNCTIADNNVTGSPGMGTGLGGGLYCSNNSNVDVINSIIWGNVSPEGAQVAVVKGFDKKSSPSNVTISYSDIGPRSDPNQTDPIVTIAASGIGSQQSVSGPLTSGSGKLIEGGSIYRKFDEGQEKVKVIVTLAEPIRRATTNWNNPQSVAQLRTDLSARQASVLTSLTADEFTTKHRYQNVAAFSGEVSREGLQKLLANSLVRFVEPVRIDRVMLAQALPQANALEIRHAYSGKGVAIAIVDTGVDYTHPMLGGTETFPNAKVIGGYNTGDDNADPMAGNPHGTACAGIAAGSLGNIGFYVGGVAYDARIYALKASPGNEGYLLREDEIAAWDWCITHRNDDPTHPIKVISNSWGGGPWTNDPAVGDAASPAMTTLADTAVGLGITILAASGNEFSAGQGIGWPSCMSNVISVGAIYDSADMVLPYSNTDENLDILAPADPVYTTDIVGPFGYTGGDYVPNFNGTSSATPFAAGCVASIQNAAMDKIGRYLTPAEVRSLLIATGDPVTDTKVSITKPRINLAAAIRSPSGPPIYIEQNCVLNDWQAPVTSSYVAWDTAAWDGNVIEEDPNFIVGYYLSQFAAGQVTESNCVDGGSDLASVIGLDTRTTRTDGVNDANIVDIGYHYDREAPKYQLTVTVRENPDDPGIHGLVDPNSGWYYEGTELTLTARPDEDYYLQGWYDANGVLISISKELEVVMDSNQVYEVRFRLPRKVEVSGRDTAIAEAVNSAQNGDTLVVAGGTYDGDINFRGKEIKIVSTNPDDPNIIAGTIIDCGNTTRAFTFNNGEGPGSMINGVTIINGGLSFDHGGAIYIGPNCSPTIVNVTIRDCEVQFGSGGAIYADANSSPTFDNVTIINCATVEYSILADPNDPTSLVRVGGGGNGGGVYLNINSSPVFTNCTISGCSTEGSGGAIYSGSYSSARFTRCDFEDNHASLNGGGIYHASNSASTLNGDCMFNGNEAEYSGGAIYYNISCRSDVNDCNFADNSALGTTTSSFQTDPNDPNTLVTITDNSPVGMGGGIYCNSGSLITMVKNTFETNSAEEGGGFYLDANCVAEVNDCNIIENTAARGGGLFCIDCPDSTIINCSINRNEAINVITTTLYFLPDPNDANAPPVPISPDDPAFNPNDPNLIIIRSQDRSGVGQGGGIYSFAGPTLIADCQINYNTTSTSGGGIYFAGSEYKPITLRNCLLTNNLAGRDGGGISNNWQNVLEISNCTIADNGLTGIYSFGGGLYGSYDSNTVITNSIIWNNMASRGTQIAIGSDDPADPLPSVLEISNSNIDLRVGEVVTLVDPNFVPVIRPGFDEFSLAANDDLSSGLVDIGFNINYFGIMTSTLYVNNNGNVTFDAPMWTFTPFALTTNIGTPVIAPFFADVDTREGEIVTYGRGMVNGRPAFGVNWIDVGYFATHVDKLNSFQLILINRSDRALGDFDIEFNYGTINWETGDASMGQDGFAGFSARAGFSHGSGNPGTYYEIEGSGANGAFLDSNPTGLVHGSRNSSVLGRYIFTVVRGALDIGLFDIPIYVEDGCTVVGWEPDDPTYPLDPNAPNAPWDPETNNIAVDPNFVAGYYLSQTASGQNIDSLCVDAGSGNVDDPNIGLSDYTTRTDGVNDVNVVDLGYHYKAGLLGYHLTVTVIGDPNDPNIVHGYVEPNDVTIYLGFDSNVITLTAYPDVGYKVKKWTGTDNDRSTNWSNTVTLTGDRNVTIEFEPAARFSLTARVIDRGEGPHGTVEPVSGTYFDGQTITLTATPEQGYRVKAWTGTDNDASTNNINTVTINGANAVVTVEFWQPVPAIISVPGDYQTIQEAVTAAEEGDTIVVDTGIYYEGYLGSGLIINKSVHITSRDPHDPNTVEATIISGYAASDLTQWNNLGVIFMPGTDANTVLNGFTIEYFGGNWGDGDDGDRDNDLPNGEDGASGEGAGILIMPGTSPVIKNCIIRNNVVNAGDGGDGVDADEDNNAGRGGWGGWAHGAGVYCASGSSPKLINCVIENNVARGGSGGDGGDYDEEGGYPNYGGNFSRSSDDDELNPVINILTDPNSLEYEVIEGHLWQVWEYAGDYRYYSGYGGGVYCGTSSNVELIHCEIRGNRTYGGMSGQGGVGSEVGREIEPLVPYEIPSYGGGVYCAANSTVMFNGCTFEDNVASETLADPNHRLSPYIGYGGGVCAENNALVSFIDCNFIDNQADTGGGIYVSDTHTTIIDCNITSNESLRGGGFFGTRGEIDVKRSIIVNNQAVLDVNDPNDDDVLSIGAGLCFWSVNANIFDCTIRGNRAQASGGGAYLRGENESLIRNCLIINNAAGREGGGVSINWYARPTIANCTFSGNAAPGTEGEQGNTGLGGALYCGYQSDITVTDSILWNNYALKGQEIAVGGGFTLDPIGGKVTVKHSDVKSSLNHVWIDPGCILSLTPSDGNIDDDPLFVSGYYLSQTDADQSRTSPCVNRGSNYASHVGLLGYTTRTDHYRDTGTVDMGYHYDTGDKCRFADFVFDGVIDLRDYDKFAQILGFVDFEKAMEKWLEEPLDLPSSDDNEWRSGTDITTDGRVNGDDLNFLLIVCEGAADINAPTPNPSEWYIEPYISSESSISMEAKEAFDAWSRDVKYEFDCITPGGHDSGWQDGTEYTDTGITIGAGYGYRVRARDKFGHMTEWSQLGYSGIDTIPPAPAPYIESIDANSPTSVTMVATVAYDYSGVEYYFENTHGNGHDSGWQAEPNFTDVNLAPDAEYSYRVKARDTSSRNNETAWSATMYIRTPVPPDTDPPTPDPMEWDPTVDANGFDGTPRLVNIGGGTFDYYAVMTAIVAVDAGGGPVEYFFDCTTENGFDSGWIATPTYRVPVGGRHQIHRFRVRARDQFGNMTAWSDEDVAD